MINLAQPFALLADLRANVVALKAVLADLEAKDIHQLVVLGDLVGSGPDPYAVAELIYKSRSKAIVIIGHPSTQIVAECFPPQLNVSALKHFTWVKRQLMPSWRPWDSRRSVWRWLKGLPARFEHGDYLFVCGTPQEPDAGFLEVLPIVQEDRIRALFSASRQITVVGTISIPGMINENEPSWRTPEELGGSFNLPSHKVVLCPGGIGQPRNRDPRACYAILHERKVTWHRVNYDVEQAIARVDAQGIEPRSGERLRIGV